MSAKRIYGIDLGTTYSCIAYVDDHGQAVVVPNADSQRTTPSVVFLESESNIVSGQAAKDAIPTSPDRVISNVKRKMGDGNISFSFDGRSYKPPEISAFILRKLAQDAKQTTGDEVTDVVITCPAYFGIEQKEATKQAGEIAGLNVRYVIPEPTAAAIAYGMEQEGNQIILVYDLGGGTFDVTLIEIKDGAINVIATGGDDQLGGKDWDGVIVSYLAQRFQEETGTPANELLESTETLAELQLAAEQIKKSLTARQTVPYLLRHGSGSAKIEVSRAKFDELTAALLAQTISCTEGMLDRGKQKGYGTIDKLLLVGGSTRMPQVMEQLKRFPFEIKFFDPDESVAKGAALFGMKCMLDDSIRSTVAEQTGQSAAKVNLDTVPESARRAAEATVAKKHGFALPELRRFANLKIRNVTAKSYGLVVVDEDDHTREAVANLVVRDQPVPCEVKRTFGTAAEGQSGVELRIMENQILTTPDEVVELDHCKDVGKAEVTFKHRLPKNSGIEVSFRLTEDGRLDVFGRDVTTGQEGKGTWKTDGIMAKEEVEEARSRNLGMTLS